MSEDLELQDSLQPDPPVEPVKPTVDVEKVLKENEELKQKNSQLFERTKKAEEKAKAVPTATEVDFLETAKVAKKYGESELEIIANYAKRTGMTVAQAEKDDVVQLAIQAQRDKIARESAIPTPSGASSEPSGNYKKVEEMSREEHMQFVKEKMAEKGIKS